MIYIAEMAELEVELGSNWGLTFLFNNEFPSKLDAYMCLISMLVHNLITFVRRPLCNIILK